jgi:hypothetical protein
MLSQLPQSVIERDQILGAILCYVLCGREIDDADTASVGSFRPLP